MLQCLLAHPGQALARRPCCDSKQHLQTSAKARGAETQTRKIFKDKNHAKKQGEAEPQREPRGNSQSFPAAPCMASHPTGAHQGTLGTLPRQGQGLRGASLLPTAPLEMVQGGRRC